MNEPTASSPIERYKAELGPDLDFRALAQRSFDSLSPGELAMCKWRGIYPQPQRGRFMLRVRIPGGLLGAAQLRAIAEIADAFAQGELTFTTRQSVQLHGLRLEDLHEALEALGTTGLDSKNACGDVTRTVVTCPLAGVCPHEVGDVRATLGALADDPELRDVQRNLPRKHKICVAGCDRACAPTLINCQGWVPTTRKDASGADEPGFVLYAGGGLGARPALGRRIFEWVPDPLVVPVARAVVEHFRRHGDRRHRTRARLKVVVERLGAARFGDEVLAVLAERGIAGREQLVLARDPLPAIRPSFLEGQVVLAQRQPGLHVVRLIVPRGELTASRARDLAALAAAHGDGSVVLTARQNVLLRGVPQTKLGALLSAVDAASFTTDGLEHAPDAVACVGTSLCKLAQANTPHTYHRLLAELRADEALWRAVGPLRIHLNGCTNACAQHWIADLGLRGLRRGQGSGSVEGFALYAGGSLEGAGSIGQRLAELPAASVPGAVKALLRFYLARRHGPDERFGAFARRSEAGELASALDPRVTDSTT